MSIETIGSMKNIIKIHQGKEWVSDLRGSSKKLDLEKVNLGEIKPAQTFSELLMNSVQKVNSLQEEANDAIQKLASGKSKNIHETMLAVEKADIAFRTMNQVRNKIIDAYKEVMRMQV